MSDVRSEYHHRLPVFTMETDVFLNSDLTEFTHIEVLTAVTCMTV